MARFPRPVTRGFNLPTRMNLAGGKGDFRGGGARIRRVEIGSNPPPAGGWFPMVGSDWPKPVTTPLANLPSDHQAALMVKRSKWEPRPHNQVQNDTDAIVPETGLPFVTPGFQGLPSSIWSRVTGICPLSKPRRTDELIQWAAAKWGIADDWVRAQCELESYWFQGEVDQELGYPIVGAGFSDPAAGQGPAPPPHPGFSDDCQFNRSLGGTAWDPATPARQNGPNTFGMAQAKYSAFRPNPPGTGLGSYPWLMLSTAYLLDFFCANLRGNYMGLNSWLSALSAPYAAYVAALAGGAAGDVQRSARNWFSGDWDDANAAGQTYLTNLLAMLAARDWLNVQNGSSTVTSPERIWTIGNWVPVNILAPALSGTPQLGVPFAGAHGDWLGWPRPTFVYQWQRNTGGGYANIGGATSFTYTPVVGDVGFPLRLGVTATNAAGPATIIYTAGTANTTAPAAPPANTSPPVVHAAALWKGSFLNFPDWTNSWYEAAWGTSPAAPTRVGFLTDPVNGGRQVAAITVLEADLAQTQFHLAGNTSTSGPDPRADVSGLKNITAGMDTYIAIEAMFSSGFTGVPPLVSGSNFYEVFCVYVAGGAGDSPVSLRVGPTAGDPTHNHWIWRKAGVNVWEGPAVTVDTWQRVIFHVSWQTNATGFVEIMDSAGALQALAVHDVGNNNRLTFQTLVNGVNYNAADPSFVRINQYRKVGLIGGSPGTFAHLVVEPVMGDTVESVQFP